MTEGISMREASRVLGVSQIRVRELIRKGTLAAEKVTDAAGERWSIPQTSLDEYLAKRAANQDGQPNQPAKPAPKTQEAKPKAPQPASEPASNARLAQLVGVVERELARVGTLLDEVGKLRSSLDGLQQAQASIVRELERVRRELEKPEGTEQPKAEKPKAEKPKTEKAKTEKPKAAKSEADKPEADKSEPPAEEKPSEEKAGGTEQPELPESAASGKRAAEASGTEKPAKKTRAKPKAKTAASGKAKSDDRSKSANTALAAALRDAGVDAEDEKPKGGGRKKRS